MKKLIQLFGKKSYLIIAIFCILTELVTAQPVSEYKKYSEIIKKIIYKDYKEMYREAGGSLNYPFLTPGSAQYADVLWDWDSWLSNIALRQILLESGSGKR